MHPDTLVLVSGGVDSLLLAERAMRAGRLGLALQVYYPHPAQAPERRAVSEWRRCCWLAGRTVPFMGLDVFLHAEALGDEDGGACVVPGRNLALLALAGNIAAARGLSVVQIGACAADQPDYPDCRPDYLDGVGGLLSPWGVTVEAPLWDVSKAQIMEEADRLGVLDISWSCYRPEAGAPCGRCASCVERSKG